MSIRACGSAGRSHGRSAAPLDTGAPLQSRRPHPRTPDTAPGAGPRTDVSPDGRFLIPAQDRSGSAPFTVIVNWPALLK